MSQILQISFWVRKNRTNKKGQSPLVVRLSISGQRIDFQPNILVNTKFWDSDKQKMKSKDADAKVINDSLELIKHKLWGIYHQLISTGDIHLHEILEVYRSNGRNHHKLIELTKKHNAEFKSRLDIDRSYSTYEKYIFTLQKIQAYIKLRYNTADIPISNIDKKWMEDFYLFLRKEEKNEHNTAAKYVKNLKHILSYGVDISWIEHNPADGYICSYKETEQVILGPEELSRIENKRFQIPRLELARKLFIFQCYTGLSYADMAKLEKSNIEQGPDGKLWLNVRRSKTDTVVRYPILKQAAKIIEEISIHSDSEKLFPQTISNQKMNSYLKEIADLCYINKNLTTHVGRRTMASTVLLGNGVPIETISRILGHLKITTTMQYAKVGDQLVSKEIQQLENRLAVNRK
jgi:integrase